MKKITVEIYVDDEMCEAWTAKAANEDLELRSHIAERVGHAIDRDDIYPRFVYVKID